MCPVLPDGNDAGRKATREITAISAMQAHPASAKHQLDQRATGQQQFCETSLIFERDNVKNETILLDFFRS